MTTPLQKTLAGYMRRKKLTQAKLAELLKLHPNGLAKILDGRATPQGTTLGRMVRLGVPLPVSVLRSL